MKHDFVGMAYGIGTALLVMTSIAVSYIAIHWVGKQVQRKKADAARRSAN